MGRGAVGARDGGGVGVDGDAAAAGSRLALRVRGWGRAMGWER